MLDLANPSDREALEELISSDVEQFCATYYESGHRNHLGASELGEECWRKLWYGFRWCKQEAFSGRMLRLFNVGHSAEPRFIAYLRGIGFEVREYQQQLWYNEATHEYMLLDWGADLSGGTGAFIPVDDKYHILAAEKQGIKVKQYRISGAKGHYGGSLDGMSKPPARYEIVGNVILLNEYKTNNTGKGYADVATLPLAKSKPKHWAQKCQYGYKYGIRYGLYMIENKNDSSLTFKVVELDWNLGAQMELKATEIIFAKEPPNRISDNPAFLNCKWCNKAGICHGDEVPEKNCRSCRNSMPTDNATWTCSLHNAIIPEDFIKLGCDQWLPI